MASSSSSPASPNPVGLWFCQISSGLQGRWQSQSQSSRAEPQGAGGGEAGAGDAAAAGSNDDQPTTRTCRGGAMPEATVYLLLDRFAPS